MPPRFDYYQLSSDLVKNLTTATLALRKSSLGNQLLDLVNIRASQINGCAFCVDMHIKEAKIHGERDLRVHHVTIWKESPLFSERERAALAWTEAVTRLGHSAVSDDDYEQVRSHFSDQELSDLTFAIALINAWNRLSVSSRTVPGSADKLFGLEKAGF